MRPDEVRVVGQDTAALPENLIKVTQCLEILIGQWLVGQRPQMLCRLNFRRVRGQEHQLYAFRNLQVIGDMPSCAIKDQDNMLARTSADLTGKGCENGTEQCRVDAVHDIPHHLAGRRTDKAVHMKPLEPMVAMGDGTAAARGPDRPKDRLQSDSVLIERPDFDR